MLLVQILNQRFKSSFIFILKIWIGAAVARVKDVMEGKLFQKWTHLLCEELLSLGGNVNIRRMSKSDMGSIFHIKKSMKYSGHRKLLCELSKLSKFNAFNLLRILNEHWCIYSYLQIPPKENWFRCVRLRRVYTTAINFPCITPLIIVMYQF